jgi:hypothetical protein
VWVDKDGKVKYAGRTVKDVKEDVEEWKDCWSSNDTTNIGHLDKAMNHLMNVEAAVKEGRAAAMAAPKGMPGKTARPPRPVDLR